MITADSVVQGIFIGIIAAVLAVGYNKLVIGKFVKALIKAEAVHPAFAKTFDELNIRKNIFISFALRNSGTLRKIVFERIDNSVGGYYYIPEDKLYRAGRMYGGKDVDPLMLAAVIIVFFIFFAFVLYFLPSILDYVSQVFGNMTATNSGNNTGK